jgi:endonuclease/exonuclease/phosphatase family metal-dependent hydrolase
MSAASARDVAVPDFPHPATVPPTLTWGKYGKSLSVTSLVEMPRSTEMPGWLRPLVATLAALLGAPATAQSVGPLPFDGSLSVMTYNVKGAPWPITRGRGPDLRAIGDRLRQLRAEGRQPHIVLLQEAFSGDARAIASRAGYRFVAAGPGPGDRSASPASGADAQFLAGRSLWRGELSGTLFGSGLLLLSDYPITQVRRFAFPAFACAGFDCLANKGALLATVTMPGATPVDIVATHLNSRHSARVADARSLYAYRRQVTLLSDFIRTNRDPGHPLIVAGDFNVGAAPARDQALAALVPSWADGAPVVEALGAVAAANRHLGQDAEAAVHRNTDFEFVAGGRSAELIPLEVLVPFGREPTGHMLSDHIGYAITFGLRELDRPQVRFGATSLR